MAALISDSDTISALTTTATIAMRTPSLYSQDDPFSAALKPSPSETDTERRVRQAAEAEARRVSEQIDEELRQERERMKRSRGDVKVCSDVLCTVSDAYTHVYLVAATRSSGKRKINPPETIPTDVQAEVS